MTPSSSARRRDSDSAATRRGWVQTMRPSRPRPASRQILGSWVVFPDPVSPGDDDDLVPRDRPEDLLLASGDRQLFGVRYRRDEAEAFRTEPPGGLDALAQPVELAGKIPAGAPGKAAAQILQSAADLHAVDVQAVLQRRLEVADPAGVVRGRARFRWAQSSVGMVKT